jgi:hypothetical protein
LSDWLQLLDRIRAPSEDTARQIGLEAVATVPRNAAAQRARPEFFLQFFVRREMGGTADLDLCFGQPISERRDTLLAVPPETFCAQSFKLCNSAFHERGLWV